MENNNITKNSCSYCNYNTKYKKDYNRHIKSIRHLKNVSSNTITSTKNNYFLIK